MTTNTGKSCLIISYGPVPTPQYQTVEGGGMRAWGLAKGLQSHGVNVTVGINDSFPQDASVHEDIKLINWGLNGDFVQQLNSYDSVVVSYCMGDPSVFIADNLNDDVQLILDAYVPIYVEVSARDSKEVASEYTNYMSDIAKHNHTLKRGDYFLYANSAQELMYTGVLSALGVINPASYRKKRLLHTPFGIHRVPAKANSNPYGPLGIKRDDFVVLWFGGIYPWFRVEEYLQAIKKCSDKHSIKFVFVGGKNPFNPNPDFSRQYDQVVDFATRESLVNKTMFFIDWVDFNNRIDWYAHADVIVSLNQPGEENKYSWRTRVMDYIWGEAVTISNGGDPLSEELINEGAAIRLDTLSAKDIVAAILEVQSNPKLINKARKSLIALKERYFWDVTTASLSDVIKSHDVPYAEEQPLRDLIQEPPTESGYPISTLRKLTRIPGKVYKKARQKGIRRSAGVAKSILKTHFEQQVSRRSSEPQFVFISHPINNTGGPVVLLQIIKEYVKKYGPKRVRVIAPGIEKEQEALLRTLGIKVEQAVFGADFRFIRLQLALRPTDFVLMNTVAIYDNYRDFILAWLRLGRLNHAYWFVHEDIAQLPFIHKEFLEQKNLSHIKDLVDNDKISLLFPSKRTASEYKDLLSIEDVSVINLHVEVDKKLIQKRSEDDFNKINFLLSGTAGDGRKGQFLAISAFYRFVKEYYDKKPDNYRSFSLQLVAIGDDYVSQQIRWTGESLLGKNILIHPSLPKDRALEITASCNAVICSSLNETFGLYIAEGMLMGHILLRNNVAGVDEQLDEGVNGYKIDHTDMVDFSQKIEQLLNKYRTPNSKLLEMSKASQRIINEYGKHSYFEQIDNIKN